MKIYLLFLALMVLLGCGGDPVYAQYPDLNYSGFGDTLSLTLFKKDSLRYSRKLELSSPGEDIEVICKNKDAAAAGFASDSVKFAWGYQLWTVTIDTAGNRDTVYDLRITLDTMDIDSFGKTAVGYQTTTGNLVDYFNRYADTTNVTGYAIQKRWFVPKWSRGIRFWAKGLSGNRIGSVQIVIFDVQRRIYSGVRGK